MAPIDRTLREDIRLPLKTMTKKPAAKTPRPITMPQTPLSPTGTPINPIPFAASLRSHPPRRPLPLHYEAPVQRLPQWVPLFPRKIRWTLAALLAALIVFLSLIPDPPIPRDAADAIGLAAHADKLAHFAAYFALTSALCYARYHPLISPRHTALFSFIIATIVGILVELLQGLVPHRHLDLGDMLANINGAAVAALLWLALTGLMKDRPPRPTE